jgi:hypothetical protein
MTAGLTVRVFSAVGFLPIVLRACALIDRARCSSLRHRKGLVSEGMVISEVVFRTCMKELSCGLQSLEEGAEKEHVRRLKYFLQFPFLEGPAVKSDIEACYGC